MVDFQVVAAPLVEAAQVVVGNSTKKKNMKKKNKVVSRKIKELLSEDDFIEIRKAVDEAEKITSGEIRVAITKSSVRIRTLLKKNTSRVYEAAKRKFEKLGMANTKQRTGVLIFVSVRERKVEILADSGVYPKTITPDFLQQTAKSVSANIGLDMAKHGIVNAIKNIATQMSHDFPYDDNDCDELPNDVDRE